MASPGELERHISWWRPKFAGLHLSQMAISHEGKHRETVRLNQNVLRVPKVLETMRKPTINHNFSISLDSTHAWYYMSDHSCCDVRLEFRSPDPQHQTAHPTGRRYSITSPQGQPCQFAPHFRDGRQETAGLSQSSNVQKVLAKLLFFPRSYNML